MKFYQMNNYCYQFLYRIHFCNILFIQTQPHQNQKMSQQHAPKKTYLKRGTRQFLSNAQVRSQSTKQKIVQFTNEQQDPILSSTFKASKKINTNNKIREDFGIEITVNNPKKTHPDTKSASKIQSTVLNVPPSKQKKQKDIMIPVKKAQQRKSPVSRKKQTNLADYLDGEQFVNKSVEKKAAKDKVYGRNYNKQIGVQDKQNKANGQRNGPLAGFLRQQQEESDQENYNQLIDNNSSFRPIANPMVKKQRSKSPLREPQLAYKNYARFHHQNSPVATKHEKSSINKQLQKQQKTEQRDEFNFVSDQSESDPEQFTCKENMNKNMNMNQRNKRNSNPNSQVKQKYFQKNQPQTTHNKQQILNTSSTIPTNIKKLTINDISQELKNEIVSEQIAQKEKQLFNQILKVKQKYEEAARSKHKLQEQNKAMSKAKIEFEKQMEEKYAQFEEKMKSEQSKLIRQKRYMKDIQMAGKGDWKSKNQITEMKKLLQETKQQKKRIQKKLKTELEQTRKKYEEQTLKNKNLMEQIKFLEYNKLAQKQQMAQIQKQTKKIVKQKLQLEYYANAPKQSYFKQLLQSGDEFSLKNFDLESYHYQNNEFYQFYMEIRNQQLVLEAQQQENDRVKRTYTSGKIEHQFYNKFLKEKYPFDYMILHHNNGDVKQELFNRQLIIYYSQKTNATELKCKNKIITYFHKNDTVQMEIQLSNQGKIDEVYNGNRLRREHPDGKVIEERTQK